MRLDKFDLWRYDRLTANCWHFVRLWLIEKAGIPEQDAPLSKALPLELDNITRDFKKFRGVYRRVETPSNHCVCMQFAGSEAVHVGVFYNNHVYHVSSRSASRIKDTLKNFQRKAKRTEFYEYAKNSDS